jgi:VWFA-related protein
MRQALLAAAISATICLSAQDPVIRTTVPLILVPATVTDRRAKTINGLTESDFQVLDNGQPVKHSLESTNQPIALVVAVQTTAAAGPALAKIQKIGAMFEPLVVGEGGMAAIVTYSDHVTVLQDFTHSFDDFIRRMRKIEPAGDSPIEAHMNDAVLQAVKMLTDRPKFRRVLVVIGESRDRGSQTKLQDAVTAAQDERFKGSGQRVYNTDPGNLLAVFTEIARLGTQNGGDALAKYTGGEKVSFTKLSGLERVIANVGEDLHTQYLLSFVASDSESKTYHAITVNVKRPEAVVRARPGYWPE